MKFTKAELKKIEEVEKKLDPLNWIEEGLQKMWSDYSVKPTFMVVGNDLYTKWLNSQKKKKRKLPKSKKH